MSDGPVKVLLVDDDEDDYIITRDLISRIAGRYHLDWVNNFSDALAVNGCDSHNSSSPVRSPRR